MPVEVKMLRTAQLNKGSVGRSATYVYAVCEDGTISCYYRSSACLFHFSSRPSSHFSLFFPAVCIPLQMLCNNVFRKNYSFVSWQHSTTEEEKSVLLRTRMYAMPPSIAICNKRKREKESAIHMGDRIIFQPNLPFSMNFNSWAREQRALLLRYPLILSHSLAWNFSTPSVVLIYILIVSMRFDLRQKHLWFILYMHPHTHCLPIHRMLQYACEQCVFPSLFQLFGFSILFRCLKFLIWSILRKRLYLWDIQQTAPSPSAQRTLQKNSPNISIITFSCFRSWHQHHMSQLITADFFFLKKNSRKSMENLKKFLVISCSLAISVLQMAGSGIVVSHVIRHFSSSTELPDRKCMWKLDQFEMLHW